MGTIVAGSDGSAGAQGALAWATDEARRRRSDLHVVHAWEAPITAYPGALMGASAVDIEGNLAACRECAEQRGAQLRAWLSANADGVASRVSVVEGSAAATLLDAAIGAELLVLGSRGHGGFSTLLLGSVSDRCAREASSTVVIVPAAGAAGA